MEKTIILLDDNRTYAARLAMTMNHDEEFPYNAIAVSSREDLESLRGNEPPTILLYDEAMEEEANQFPASRKICMTERSVYGESAGPNLLCKYQAYTEIRSKLLSEAPSSFANPVRRDASIITFTSPIGRCGKSQCAYLLARIFSEKEKTVFLSLEPYSMLTAWISGGQEPNLSDLLYEYLKGDKETVSAEPYIFHNKKTDVILPVESAEDLFHTEPGILTKIVRGLSEEYDRVIIDAGYPDDRTEEIFLLSDYLLIPTLKDSLSIEKARRFSEHLKRIFPKDDRNRMWEIEIPREVGLNKEESEERLMFGEMGNFAKHLWESIKGYGRIT